MENLRKIKKMKDSQIKKQLAIIQMLNFKKSQLESQSSTSSFVSQEQKSFIQSKMGKKQIFTIKNLDANKVQLIDKEEKVTVILQDVDELPEIQKIIEKVWSQYLNEKEKQEEQFLEACYQGNIQRVKKVLKGKNLHPIDPQLVVTAEGKNGIHLATISGSYRRSEIITELIQCKVDINGRTFLEKRTPLMLGCILGNQIAVKSLLQNKANIDLQDYEGNTALHLACIFNQQDLIEVLQAYDPDLNIANLKGHSAAKYVSEKASTQKSFSEEEKKSRGGSSLMANFLTKLSEKQAMTGSETSLMKKSSLSVYKEKIKNVSIKDSQNMGLSNFKKLSLLGKGAFGQVFLVENILDKKQYAMKALDKASIMQQNILRYAMTERKILSTINHPFVVKLHYAFQSEKKLFLVMDYCPGGDMLRIIKKQGNLKEPTIKKYAAEIILAIEALHKAEIIYRDLKPGNVIFDRNGHACLTDFGLSKEAALSHTFCGSTAYLAPEMLWKRGHTKVLDWYLLGVLIYETLTGKPPFWDMNKEQLFSNIKSGRFKPLGSEFTKQVKDLIEKLLKSNSNKRLGVEGAQQIKKHPWFNDIDWKSVQAKKQEMPTIEETKGKVIRSENFSEIEEEPSDSVKGWNYSIDC